MPLLLKHIYTLLYKAFIGCALVLFSLPSFSQEICDNCIDDDGDGLIDCFDPDCCGTAICENNSYDCLPTETQGCAVVFPVTIKSLWTNNVDIDTRRTPLAGDIDNDGITEVIAAGSGNQGLVIINGSTGVTEQILSFRGDGYFDAPAIADVNGDGYAEIFAVDNNSTLIRWEYSGGSFVESVSIPNTWVTNPTIGYGVGTAFNWSPALADFNHDGIPEVYFGNQIYNAQNGLLVAESINGTNDPFGRSSTGANVSGAEAYSSAADVLPDNFCPNCDGLELVAGPVVYSINYATKHLQIEVDARGPANVEDGTTSIADWDGDGELDVVVNSASTYLYVYNPRTGNLFYPPYQIPNSSLNSHPSVSDIDNDGKVELVAPGRSKVVALDNDFSVLWQRASNDGSSKTTASLYDLNGDYIFELIYLDEDGLHIWDAATGANVQFIPCASGTRTNYPIVADVNGDGEANIICSCKEQSPFPGNKGATGQIHAFKSDKYPWLPSRSVMNQHSYYITNINDDLTVCRYQQNNAKAKKLNQYLSQSTYYGGIVGSPVPDATINNISATYICDNSKTKAVLNIEVCNENGDKPIPIGAPIALYEDDPSNGNFLKLIKTTTAIDTGECALLKDSLIYNLAFDLYAVVNDSALIPDDDLDQLFLECDSSNNVKSIPLEIIEPKINLAKTNVICFGESNGKAFPTLIQNLTAPYTYTWSNGATSDTLTDFAGSYTLNITDINNCSASENIIINEPAVLNLSLSKVDAPCDDLPEGEISAIGSGGVGPYTYNINGNTFQSSNTFTNLSSGTYTVSLKDANECIITEQIYVDYLGDTPLIEIDSVPSACLKEGDIALSVSPNTGYFIGNGIAQPYNAVFNTEVAQVGTHNITYSIDGVCPTSESFTVTVINEETPIINGPRNVCIEKTAINYTVNSTNGNWVGNYISPTGVFNPNAAGEGAHLIQYKIGGQCPSEASFTINVQAKISANINPVSPVCVNTPAFNLSAVNPNGNWAGNGIINSTLGTFDASVSGIGNHTITYTISGLCGDVQTTTITVIDTNHAVITAPDSLCADVSPVSLTATPSNGSWISNHVSSNGIFKAPPGQHQVIYENLSQCGVNDTLNIIVRDTLKLVSETKTVACFGDLLLSYGIKTINAIPPMQYTWPSGITNHQADSAFNISSGTYNLSIEDNIGCKAQGVLKVEEPSPIQIIDKTITHLSCGGIASVCDGSVLYTLSGGTVSTLYNITSDLGFIQSSTENKIESLCAGTHSITITDDNGCSIQDQVVINQPAGIQLSLQASGDEHCDSSDGFITMNNPSGGTAPFTYLWNNGTTSKDNFNLKAGVHTLTVTDANGCTGTFSHTLINIPGPDITINTSPITCFNGTDGELEIVSSATNVVSYVWNTGETSAKITGLASGNYTGKIVDSFGCETTKTILLANGPKVNIEHVNNIDLCANETKKVPIKVSNGNGPAYTYYGNYSVLSNDTLLISTGGTYTIYSLDHKGCSSDTITFTVSQLPPLQISPLNDTTLCIGEQLSLTAKVSGGREPYAYLWNTGHTSATLDYVINKDTTLNLNVIDDCGELKNETVKIDVYPTPIIPYKITPREGCEPLDVTYLIDVSTITNPVLQVNDQTFAVPTNGIVTYTFEKAGLYYSNLTFKSSYACTVNQALDDINVYPLPFAKILCSPKELSLHSLTTRIGLSAPSNLASTVWTVFDHTDTLALKTSYPFYQTFPEKEMLYSVRCELTSPKGCLALIQETISVKNVSEVYVPNTFTPDGDGYNEFFTIGYFNINETNFEVLIFNRWGEEIFKSNNPNFKWNGLYQGELVKQDVYVYKIRYEDHNLERKELFGHINVLR